MARSKKLEIGAINITIQPHSAKRYVSLFRDVRKLKKSVHIRSDQHGIITGVSNLKRDQQLDGPIYGDIFKFTAIAPNAPWFNTQTNDFASDDDFDDLSIPEHLKPNSSRFTYIFYPDKHILFYESYYDGFTLTPQNAVRFFDRILNQEEIVEKYGKVNVVHIPQEDKVSEALQMPVKERLEMEIKRPNPDDLAESERKFLKRMNNRNVESHSEKLKAIPGMSIEVDRELETLARIAAKNGSLYLKGKDEDSRPAEFSTKEYPFTLKDYYDPDLYSPFDILVSITSNLKDKINDWFKV